MKKNLMALFAAVLLSVSSGCGSRTSGLNLQPMPPTLVLGGQSYTLTVNRSPYSFTVAYGAKTVLSSIPCTASSPVSATGSYSTGSSTTCTSSASGYSLTPDGADVYLRSSRAGWITYSFRLSDTMIQVTISSQSAAVENIGDAFSVATSGHWYGQGELGNYENPVDGTTQDGEQWFPLETGSFTRCPLETADQNNITTPLWLTSNGAGLFVDSYGPICVSMGSDVFMLSGNGDRFSYDVLVDRDIPSLYRDWISTDFTLKKAWRPVPLPAPDMFKGPVWSTWAQYLWNISQTTVISFAKDIEFQGFPYSILEIDDKWQKHWGDTDFDPAKFPDPKAMVSQLHAMGFKVSLWVPPFVDNDSSNFDASTRRYFVQAKSGGVDLIDWWDTFGIKKAGLINFADHDSLAWWAGLLAGIVSDYGIDGFKFDAGEANWFPPDGITSGYLSPNQYADFYIALHERVPAMEFRSGWFSQDQGQIMREYDKDSTWGNDNGLKSVLTQMFALGMIGYPFVLPDMIGGNAYPPYGMPDSELYIRWIEMNAFMPLMQISIAPWNPTMGGLSTQTTSSIARFYAGIHESLSTYMTDLALSSAQTGMPMVKPLFFDYPTDSTTYTIDDEFLLGNTYLVCPVFNAGQTSRDVYLPAGTWTDYFTRVTFTGPVTLKDYPAPLQRIPVFIKQ